LGDRATLRRSAGADIFGPAANIRANTTCPNCKAEISIRL
jgi:hypothetical protein